MERNRIDIWNLFRPARQRSSRWRILLSAGILVSAILTQSAFAFRDTYPKNPRIDVINYSFRIDLNDTTDEIICETTVDLKFLSAGIDEIRLDLVNQSEAPGNKGMRVSRVVSDGAELKFTHEKDVLLIKLAKPSAENQDGKFTIKYRGIPASGLKIAPNKYGERTFFSDNWPDKARNWLATVDHPYDKAMCEFIVTAPAHYQVVSNGLKIEETDLVDGKRLTHWKQGVPIAPWLYVLGVARFAVQYVDEFEGKSIQTWVYHQDRDAGFYDFADLTKKVLTYYTKSVGPYSYEKLANIQSNSVGGGMEAASAIFYGDKSVTGERTVRWRNVIIHEIAHQWFGNAVTERDWDDVWLSEGFATYFTLLFIENEYGREAFVEGLKSSKATVDKLSADMPNYRIVHDNLLDMKDVVNQLTYQKGSWVLHMLRGVIGKKNFEEGVRSYYKKYRDKNAATADFQREMEAVSGRDLSAFFKQWLYKPGSLKLKGTWEYKMGANHLRIQLDQTQKDGSLFKMPVQVAVYYRGNAEPQMEMLSIAERSNVFDFNVTGEPERVILDPDMWVLMDAEFSRVINP